MPSQDRVPPTTFQDRALDGRVTHTSRGPRVHDEDGTFANLTERADELSDTTLPKIVERARAIDGAATAIIGRAEQNDLPLMIGSMSHTWNELRAGAPEP